MTTAAFGALASATARAMAEVRNKHCQPPGYRPVTPVRASIRCTKCGGQVSGNAVMVKARSKKCIRRSSSDPWSYRS